MPDPEITPQVAQATQPEQTTPREPEASAPRSEEQGTPKAGEVTTTTEISARSTAASPAERRLRLKIDKEDRELPEAEVIAHAQRWLASQGRFEEAAALKKEAEKLHSSAKQTLDEVLNDPFSSLVAAARGKYGWNEDRARQEVMEYFQKKNVELYQELQLPEEERARRQLARENEALKRQIQEHQQEKEADRLHYEEAIRMKKHLGDITQALTHRQIEVTDSAVDAIVSKMLALSAAGEDPTADDAIELYLQDQKVRTKDDLKKFPVEDILEVYPELAQLVAEKTLGKARAAKSAPPNKAQKVDAGVVTRDDGVVFKKAIRMAEFR